MTLLHLMGSIHEVNPQGQGAGSPQGARQPQAEGAAKYVGATAEGYDAKRESSPKWQAEQRIIQEMLSDLPGPDEKGAPRTTILDVPVGTGRFLGFYMGRGFAFVGADTSLDMLRLAALKIATPEEVQEWVHACNAAGRFEPATFSNAAGLAIGRLAQGDVRAIGMPDKFVDAAVMVRLTRWLEPHDCQVAFRELQRVSRKRVIWTARVSDHPHARPVSLFEEALHHGWKIIRNEAGHEEQYRILCAEAP